LTDVISDTSPLQYRHQAGRQERLPALFDRIVVPSAVVEELREGRSCGLDLPDPPSRARMDIRRPEAAAVLPLVIHLGHGEAETLALCLESPRALAIVDDAFARRMAHGLGISLTGTLGALWAAKRKGLPPADAGVLERLDELGFRLASATCADVLQRAGEA